MHLLQNGFIGIFRLLGQRSRCVLVLLRGCLLRGPDRSSGSRLINRILLLFDRKLFLRKRDIIFNVGHIQRIQTVSCLHAVPYLDKHFLDRICGIAEALRIRVIFIRADNAAGCAVDILQIGADHLFRRGLRIGRHLFLLMKMSVQEKAGHRRSSQDQHHRNDPFSMLLFTCASGFVCFAHRNFSPARCIRSLIPLQRFLY